MRRLVPFVTDDVATIIREALLLAVDTIDDYNQSLPAALAFQREARLAIYVIAPVIEQDRDFARELRDYVMNYNGDTVEPEEIPISKTLLSSSEKGMDGRKNIVKLIVTIIIQTRLDLSKFIEEVSPAVGKTFPKEKLRDKLKDKFKDNFKAFSTRLFQSSEILATIEAQNQEIRRLIGLLKDNHAFAQYNEQPRLEQFKDSLSTEAYRFWKGHVGQDTWTDWDRFAQAYTALYGGYSDSIDLKRIKEHLAVQEARDDNTSVAKITLHVFIALTKAHGFPFTKDAKSLKTRKKEFSTEARMEVAKMVINLMNEFASKEMQENLLVIEQLYSGIKKEETNKIMEKAKAWGVLRKQSRMMVREEDKSEDHKWADKVDFARRSVSFLYQRYMAIWRIGQLERDVLREVDFPGKGRSREFLTYYEPLDYVNYHDVRELKAELWSGGKPKVYGFLKELIKLSVKDKEKSVATDARLDDDSKAKMDEATNQQAVVEENAADNQSGPPSPQPGRHDSS